MRDQVPKRQTPPWIVLPVWLFILVVLYFGSFGPVTWLSSHRHISDRNMEFLCDYIYLPLRWMEFHTHFFDDNPLGRVYVKYVEWFEK